MRHLLHQSATVSRRTGFVLDAETLAASHPADRSCAIPYAVLVEVVGSGTPGSIAVGGTSGGGAASETLTFAGTGTLRRTTMRLFDASTSVTLTPSGWSGSWTISARAVDRAGAPSKLAVTVRTAEPCRVDRIRGRRASWSALPQAPAGVQEREEALVFFEFSSAWAPREGDEVVVGGETWRIEGVPPAEGARASHHWECEAVRAEATAG